MIHYITGNLFDSDAQALVNTVNTVGVMGKGIALQFKEAFPENFRVYQSICRNKLLEIGQMLITEETNIRFGHKIIVNFPTKKHWRHPSDYSYIQKGLIALKKEITEREIKSIAIPPLGSHNGGLEWPIVKGMIEESLSDIDCDIFLYEPSDPIINRMKSERVKLTPARALLILMFADMIHEGEFCSAFAAEKLIYFMQRFGGKELFRIDFQKYHYGPYSGGKIAHVLYHMNGSYIKGMVGMDLKPFDFIWLVPDAEKEAMNFLKSPQYEVWLLLYEDTRRFLRGFYSNFSLELLSTIDYLTQTLPSLKDWNFMDRERVINILLSEVAKWNSRKGKLFDNSKIEIALNHLESIPQN